MSHFVVQVQDWKPLDVSDDDVMSLTEAAERLGLSHASSIASLIRHGDLRWVRDTSEPNSRKQGRVLVADVEKERQRRRERHDDGRLKRKRGRPVG